MATYSTFLSLKLNDGSDSFLLSDFISNWEILDGSPGVFVCTSLTRPSWGSAQAGRTIFMTDYKQVSYWNGSSWQDPRDSAPIFAGGSFLNASMARNTSPVFTILTFTTPRPCAVTIILVATYQCSNQQTQDGYQSVVFDGSAVRLGGYREQVRFNGNSADSGGMAGVTATSIAIIPSAAAGSHTVGIECDIGTYSAPITLIGVKATAMISLYQSGNSL
jgi:hypothetical protein